MMQWKWMWLVLPDPDSMVPDTSLAFGGVRLGSGNAVPSSDGGFKLPPRAGTVVGEVGILVANARMYNEGVGVVTGTFAYVDMPMKRVSGVNVSLWDASPSRFPAVLAATPGAALAVDMQHSGWMPFTDARGQARLPAIQNLTLVTEAYEVAVSFVSSASDFVRVPVPYKDAAGRRHVCSDFRASNSSAHVRIMQRLPPDMVALLRAPAEERAARATALLLPPDEVAAWAATALPNLVPCATPPAADCLLLLDADAPHHAVEFAYHAPYPVAAAEEAALRRRAAV